MPEILISVRSKVAELQERAVIVCDNTDYVCRFDFDEEWAAYDTKTARFSTGGTYEDVVFTGDTCPVPRLTKAGVVLIGVFAGDLHTTTSAVVPCLRSALSGGGSPAAPSEDVYAQIMEAVNAIDVPVQSVNGQIGDVKLDAADVGALAADEQPLDEAYIPDTIARTEDVPTKVSQLANDKNYLTEHQELPTKLPNPNKLTLTGAVEAEYDGSEAVTVTVPKGGHWETFYSIVWDQPVVYPTAFDTETGIFTCGEGELDGFELETEYLFFPACTKANIAYNTLLSTSPVTLTKLSDTTFSISATPPDTFVVENIKFCYAATLVVRGINAAKVRVTIDGQFGAGFTQYGENMCGVGRTFAQMNVGYSQDRVAYQAYKQITAEVESPYRTVGTVLIGRNGPGSNSAYHFKNNYFYSPLIPTETTATNVKSLLFSEDGTRLKDLFFTATPWFIGSAVGTGAYHNEWVNGSVARDMLSLFAGTKVTIERWVET